MDPLTNSPETPEINNSDSDSNVGEPSEPIRTINDAATKAMEYFASSEVSENKGEVQESTSEEEKKEVPENNTDADQETVPEGTQPVSEESTPNFVEMFDNFKNDITNIIRPNNDIPEVFDTSKDVIVDDESLDEKDETQVVDPLLELGNEELLEKLYEDPKAVISLLAKQQAEKMVEPIIEERNQEKQQQQQEKQIKTMQDNIIAFAMKNDGFNEHIEKVTEIINNNPELSSKSNALKIAYSMALTGSDDLNSEQFIEKALDNLVKGQDINNLIKDESFMKQVMENETIKKEMISAYLKNLDKGEKPIAIGSSSKGQPSASPPKEKPKTFQDAAKRTLASWQ